jgi:hypothetical protein
MRQSPGCHATAPFWHPTRLCTAPIMPKMRTVRLPRPLAQRLAASVIGDAKNAHIINRMTVATPNRSACIRIAEPNGNLLL